MCVANTASRGSDAETGWKSQEEPDYLSVDLSDLDEDRELDAATGTCRMPPSRGLIAAILLALFAPCVIALVW